MTFYTVKIYSGMQKPGVSCKYVEKVAINAAVPLEASRLANHYRFCL